MNEVNGKRPLRVMAGIVLAVAGVLALLTVAASWAPDSRMTELKWIPPWIAKLADRDPNIRTAVPFVPLVVLLGWGFASCRLRWPLLWAVLISGVVLGLSEGGQVYLSKRTPDVMDLAWGTVGIVVGGVVFGLGFAGGGGLRERGRER